MPIYEYKCENGHVFDVLQKMSDNSLTECMECEAPVRKVLHPVGISFKGSGFYSTDYKNGSSAKTETASKTNGVNGESGSSSKSESSDKSTAKSESTSSTGNTSKKG